MWLFLRNLLFTVFVPCCLGVWVPLRYIVHEPRLPDPWTSHHFAAAPLLLLGAAVYAWCVWDFAAVGRGTPAPFDPPRRLVVRGLYRYVRNPMYLGVLSVIGGEALFFASWLVLGYALAGAFLFHLMVLFVEEPVLRNKFDGDYDRYCRSVRRWLPGRPFRDEF